MEFATQLRVLAADSVNVDCKLVNEGLQQDVRGFKYLSATYYCPLKCSCTPASNRSYTAKSTDRFCSVLLNCM